ncbi:antitoxin [Clostridia bacterium]|nr:antitoxin [Clostridia bacterium]
MRDRDVVILNKIIQYAKEIAFTIEKFAVTESGLESDFVSKNAISMCILQIGELVGHLSDEFKLENDAIPWQAIRGMRNIAAHNYGEFDIKTLWEMAASEVPALQEYCESAIKT